MKWVLILMFLHYDGVHSLSVPFETQAACEQAAGEWRQEERYRLLREIKAKCHRTT